jgi:hypothetical protein
VIYSWKLFSSGFKKKMATHDEDGEEDLDALWGERCALPLTCGSSGQPTDAAVARRRRRPRRRACRASSASCTRAGDQQRRGQLLPRLQPGEVRDEAPAHMAPLQHGTPARNPRGQPPARLQLPACNALLPACRAAARTALRDGSARPTHGSGTLARAQRSRAQVVRYLLQQTPSQRSTAPPPSSTQR